MRLAVIVTALVSATFAPVALAQVSPFTIQGTLVTEGGDPMADVTIFVHKGDRVAIEIGADGRLANPTGKTDSSGRFVIEVVRGFLPPTRKITLSAGLASISTVLEMTNGKADLGEADDKLLVAEPRHGCWGVGKS